MIFIFCFYGEPLNYTAYNMYKRQLGITYDIGDILQIGRFSSSGDNFVSDSGDCLFIGRADFNQKKTKRLCALQFVFARLTTVIFRWKSKKDGDKPAFLIGAPCICRANA